MHHYSKDKNKLAGFTLIETVCSLFILSVIVMLSLSAVSNISFKVRGDNPVVNNCIFKDNGDETTQNCQKTVDFCSLDRANACNTLTGIAQNAKLTLTNRNNAGKMLQKTCDRGGKAACIYFINKCVNNSNQCKISSGYDLYHYLTMNPSTPEVGQVEILNYVNEYFKNNVQNIRNITYTSCIDNRNSTACNIIASNPPDDTSFATKVATRCNSNKSFCTDIVTDCNDTCSDPATYKECIGKKSSACILGHLGEINISCLGIYNYTTYHTDGTYNLTYTNKGNSYPAYCDMTNKGWTLVLKADGGKTTFEYNSQYWTNDDLIHQLNPDNTINFEYKNIGYSQIPITQVFVVMTKMSNGVTKSASFNVPTDMRNQTLKYIVTNSTTPQTNPPARTWIKLVPGSSLQNSCRVGGYNVGNGDSFQGSQYVRIGYVGDAHSDCSFPESVIGVGIYRNKLFSDTFTADVSVGNKDTITNKLIKDFARIYVK